MRSSSLLLLAGSSLILSLASPLGAKTTTASKASVKYQIAFADLLPGGDSTVDLTLMKTQLEALKRQQGELRNRRRDNEAELSRIPPGGGDVARAGQLRADIDRLRTEIDTLDSRIQMLAYRIQTEESRPSTAPDILARPSTAPQPLPAPTSQKKVKAVSVILPEQITAAGARLALRPDLTAASARRAAVELLAQSQPGYSELEIDKLALLVMQQAAQSTQDDLQALLAEASEQNKKKAAQRTTAQAAPDTKDDPNALSPEDKRRLQELQARQARVEQVLAELTPKPPTAPDTAGKDKK